MGASQSSSGSSGGGGAAAARVSEVKPSPSSRSPNASDRNKGMKENGKVLETPIFMDHDDNDNPSGDGTSKFPTPTGHEYDLMDKIAAELPNIIDEQSKQQVDDYKQACDGGRGPMVACFATAEFISLFERKHKDAFELYKNTCYRPKTDKSPNGVLVDNTKAYPASCFNLAQMLMTGKGGVPFDRAEAYKVFDRACRAGHGGACHLQAKMLLSEPGQLGKGVPYNPQKASQLLQGVCDEGDSYSCFLLATMLLRGNTVSPDADNVSPQEARGLEDIKQRKYDAIKRKKDETEDRTALPRDPPRAEALLLKGCLTSGHAPSCYNLAVMYTQGDDGVPKDEAKAKEFQKKTEEMISTFGGFGV
jgi:TPR repeat protein